MQLGEANEGTVLQAVELAVDREKACLVPHEEHWGSGGMRRWESTASVVVDIAAHNLYLDHLVEDNLHGRRYVPWHHSPCRCERIAMILVLND